MDDVLITTFSSNLFSPAAGPHLKDIHATASNFGSASSTKLPGGLVRSSSPVKALANIAGVRSVSPSPCKIVGVGGGSFLNRAPPAPEILRSPLKKPDTPKLTRSAKKELKIHDMRDDVRIVDS